MAINRLDTKGRIVGPDGWGLDRKGGKKERRKHRRCPECGQKDVEVYWSAKLIPDGKDVFREKFRLCVVCYGCKRQFADRN